MKYKISFSEAAERLGSPRSVTLADLKRPATGRQVVFAKSIADLLDLDEPDFDDFNATSRFISEHKDEFYAEKEARESPRRLQGFDDDDDDIPF